MFERDVESAGRLTASTGPDFGKGRTIVGLPQTTPLRPRSDGVATVGFTPSDGRPPIGMAQFRGDDVPPSSSLVGSAHAHDFVALASFERAGGSLTLDGERWDITAGDVVLIFPGQVIAYEPGPHDSHDCHGWGVFFLPEALGSRASGVRLSWRAHPLLFPFAGGMPGATQRLRVRAEDQPAWAAQLAALWDELHRDDDGHVEAVSAQLTLLLVTVARLAGPLSPNARTRADPFIARVLDVIEERYHDGISLSDVARAVRLTPGHLTTVVRERTGRTVLEWITERRMAEARRLLVHTDLFVAQVARRVGYDDPAYFTRAFRRTHGTTPSAWRRSP